MKIDIEELYGDTSLDLAVFSDPPRLLELISGN